MDSHSLRTITLQANGTAIDLHQGDSFAIRLAENRTTGYRWKLGEWDQVVITNTSDKYVPPHIGVPGAAGEHVWEFSAGSPGHTTLRLEYRRSWESAPPAQTFSLTVTVT